MKHVLITGGSSGIGKGLAELYLKDGYSISLLARREDVLLVAKDSLSKYLISDAEIKTYACDVTNEDNVKAAVREALDYFGGIGSICIVWYIGFHRV